jgi:hypothetical protein
MSDDNSGDDGSTLTYELGPAVPSYRVGVRRETGREATRRHVALILVGVLGTIALGLVVFVAAGWLSIEEAKDLSAAVLSPIVAVTGTALGFYFGAARAEDD